MTDKQTFISNLNSALLARGISDVDIRPYLERFDRFYERMVNETDGINPEALNDVDNIADNIAAQIKERYDDIKSFAQRTMTMDAVAPVKDDDEEYEAIEETAPTGLVPTDEVSAELEELAEEERGTVTQSNIPNYVDEESSPSSTMFWVLFGVSIPLVVPLLAAAVGIFVAVWAGLCALILGSVAALIAVVAVGTILSLVGIIYGITQLFSVVPVGLYEIGIGVVLAGLAMFTGILLYNFAIRLLPFVIRMVGRLFRYLVKQLRVLFNYLRRECAKL